MKKYKIGMLILLIFAVSGFVTSDADIYLRINKSIETFGKVYREITLNYVDEVNPEEFMLAGIKGMLGSLDPYTVYIDESRKKDLDIMTQGKYGGIGATVGIRDDEVTIVDLLEGYSAQRQGMRIGDVIVKVDSMNITKNSYSKLGLYLKREPGTEIKVTVRRETEPDLIEFNLVSEEVEIKNVIYYSFFPENSSNAYIKLSGFSRTAGEEVKNAIFDLSGKRKIESIVLDLRGNPGGLLDAAIDVCEKFLAKDAVIVSVKGRDDTKKQFYYSHEEPVAGNKKLVVLINGNSASASEIVAGAIQDHDRGIILGDKSFGKGLVQTIVPLNFNTSLKLTTARYYTPSGRCIQKIDYSEISDVFSDHSKKDFGEFTTDHNRKVIAGGGIIPDTLVTNRTGSSLLNQLLARGYFFKFATNYYNSRKPGNLEELNDSELFSEFIKFLKSENFIFKSKTEQLISKLRKTVNEEFVSNGLAESLNSINSKVEELKNTELERNEKKIIIEIRKELAARIFGRKGRIKESLKNDIQFNAAYSVLKNEKLYFKLLNFR